VAVWPQREPVYAPLLRVDDQQLLDLVSGVEGELDQPPALLEQRFELSWLSTAEQGRHEIKATWR
jgi:hypothetical protein